MLRSEISRLQAWLRSAGIPVRALNDVSADTVEQIRRLNAIESRFDDRLAVELSPSIDWALLRHELRLRPPKEHPWYGLGDTAADDFEAQGYTQTQVERARRLWHDFLVVETFLLRDTQAEEGWIAALEYLLCRLYFVSDMNQRDIAARYYVSASTVSMRFRSLVDAVGVVVFDHPARKRLHALRTLTVETGPLSEQEFRSRLLTGELMS